MCRWLTRQLKMSQCIGLQATYYCGGKTDAQANLANQCGFQPTLADASGEAKCCMSTSTSTKVVHVGVQETERMAVGRRLGMRLDLPYMVLRWSAAGPVFAFPPGVVRKVAINSAQWGDGLACGLCIAYMWVGSCGFVTDKSVIVSCLIRRVNVLKQC